jgi:hypothetical protein
MKIRVQNSLTRVALLLIFTLLPLATWAEGTAFTYQGQLRSDGNPASGTYDLTFTLYTTGSGGTPVAGPVTNNAVVVTNGLFTVTMDFGASVWNGATNWLEIAVQTNGGSGFATLTPRQEVAPTPYAITAGNLTGSGLSGTYANQIDLNNVANQFTGHFTGNGSGVTGVNALTLNGLAASNFWQTAGNAGTTAGNNFIGTTDNQPLELHINGQRALRLEPDTNGAPNVIGGSSVNYVSSGVIGATIGGGGAVNYSGSTYSNSVTAIFGTVSGGFQNVTGGEIATISGGFFNTASGIGAFIGGGAENNASNGGSTVGGGQNNTNSGGGATIAGGEFNVASGNGAFIGGGGFDGFIWQGNVASGAASVVSGGLTNLATNNYATVGGGSNNLSGGLGSTVGGGIINTATGDYSTASGGNLNFATGLDAAIGGGSQNAAVGEDSAVAGGIANHAGDEAFVGGGFENFAGGLYATIGGGQENEAEGSLFGCSTVGGGYLNRATADFTAVLGGFDNIASGTGAFIGGGGYNGSAFGGNQASGTVSAVAGGFGNIASGVGAFIGGGGYDSVTTEANVASGDGSVIGGGVANLATNFEATVGGGNANVATGQESTVGGGAANAASGQYSTVPGGVDNIASGFASFAAGDGANANYALSFVWSDGEGESADRPYQFKIQAAGGVVMDVSGSSGLNPAALFVNSTSANGVGIFVAQNSSDATAAFTAAGTGDLIKGFNGDNGGDPVFEVFNSGDVYATSFNSTSDRNAKEHFGPVSPAEILDKVAALPISEWNYKLNTGAKHVGPMAQDFHEAFGLNGADDKHISLVDEGGVALAAIQGLNQKLEQRANALEQELKRRDAENTQLKLQNDSLAARLNGLEQAVEALAERKQ